MGFCLGGFLLWMGCLIVGCACWLCSEEITDAAICRWRLLKGAQEREGERLRRVEREMVAFGVGLGMGAGLREWS